MQFLQPRALRPDEMMEMISGGASARTLVAPGVLASQMTITRTQAGGTLSSALAADGVSLDFYAADTPRFTGTSRRLLIEGSRANIFLNSATGATQGITVTAVAHTLSFWGTGTITLTGTSTAGPLVGTGAANRVTLTFTPTAGTLTCTVSGTCSRVQMEIGSFASSYIETAGSAVTRGADLPSASLAALGLPASGAGTILVKSLRTTNTTGAGQNLIFIDDGTSSNRYFWQGNSGSTGHSVTRTLGGSGAASSNITGPAAATLYRSGLRIDGIGGAAGYISAATQAAVTGGPTSGLTTFRLGASNSGTGNYWGEVERLIVSPTIMPDAAFQAAVALLP